MTITIVDRHGGGDGGGGGACVDAGEDDETCGLAPQLEQLHTIHRR